jgi:Tfp pilus assembly protein PilX
MRNAKSTKKRGSALVVVLWILIILVLLAISIGRRTSIELRLLRYHLDRTQAFYLARAGLERVYREKANDKETALDTLDESWSNKLNSGKEPEFKDFTLGN